ncbi:AraC family transcriptional regulator [Paucibacter sp. DJ1R-11]|uniref:helix-turn-helix domain-containing protein n=1 Tax=Paucibacter sp. DJ1R-11 TaxID=2893556 RepID=UPI0021E3CD55|nr:AraC family transcriptional regulator [Paucibacter sp. DJ1R-11]MCV2362921.1 AraC family transcriptional regulator [Paucibacter sp. DJ1R-11]
MPTTNRHPDAVACLLVPSLALAGCVRACLWRDTASVAAPLSEAQRDSHFAASPLCGLTWTLQGGGWEVEAQGQLRPIEHRALLGGPRSRPAHFRSEAGIRSFMVALQPEALHALTGLDLAALLDRYVPIESVLPGDDWRQLNTQMLAAQDEQQCMALLEAFFLPRWLALQQERATAPERGRYRDWMQHLALRAIAGGHGASLRQIERRIKQWSGQSLRALRGISRAEATFFQVRREMEAGEVVWSALAQDAGYTDQAHLCRETRRVTGFSPEELRRRIEEDEAFWPYRIWA